MASSMLDYLDWRGDLCFSSDPFNDIDNLLFSEFVYLDFDGLVSSTIGEEQSLPGTVAAYFDKWQGKEHSLGAFIPDAVFTLAEKMAVSPRFGQTRLTGYRYEKSEGESAEGQLQWAAVTALFEDKSLYVAFCGTDDTLVSWKEDLHLAVLGEIPSQRAAVDYLNEVLAAYPDYTVRLGGHSKGGNLAVYAAAKCDGEGRKRITAIYDNDGPGFTEEFLRDKGYLEIRDRVRNLVPEESFVGLLLCHDLPQIVVKSTNRSIRQHDCFSWVVERNRFVQAEQLSKSALTAERVVKNWLGQMTAEETRDFVDALYKIATYADAKTLTDIVGGRRSLLTAYRKLERPDRQIVAETLRKLFEENGKTVWEAGWKPAVVRDKETGKEKDGEEEEASAPIRPGFVERLNGASLYRSRAKKK